MIVSKRRGDATDRFRNHDPAREAAYVLTGSGFFFNFSFFLHGVVFMSKVLGSQPRAFPSPPARMGQETNTKHLLSSCTDNSV